MEKIKILIIDDVLLNILGIQSLLSTKISSNFEILKASTPAEINKHIAEAKNIALAILDGDLGDGVYGYDFIKKLKETFSDIKIVMYSSEEEHSKEGLRLGADMAINKDRLSRDKKGTYAQEIITELKKLLNIE